MPEYVTATAALLGLIYPGHGMENSLRTEHVERMTIQDYIKVMSVSPIVLDTFAFLHSWPVDPVVSRVLYCRMCTLNLRCNRTDSESYIYLSLPEFKNW